MQVSLILLLAMFEFGWAANYPIDTTISIPNNGFPADSIPIRIAGLDTSLIFFTTPPTASCPGGYSGDIKGVIKLPTRHIPNPNQNYSLWNALATCGTGPNSYSAQNTYYEYKFVHRGKTHFMNFTNFIGPGSFPSGTFPEITFQLNIDTASHLNSSRVKRRHAKNTRAQRPTANFDLRGRKADRSGGLFESTGTAALP